MGRIFRGIGVKTRAGRDYYFASAAALDILTAARDAGFSGADAARVPSKIWKPMP